MHTSKLKMSVDKFGRFIVIGRAESPRVVGNGFNLTAGGDYDMQLKRVVNLKNPVESKDATSKLYVDNQINDLKKLISDLTTSYKYVDGKVEKIIKLVKKKEADLTKQPADIYIDSLLQTRDWMTSEMEKTKF